MNLQIIKKDEIRTERLSIKPYKKEDRDRIVYLLTDETISKTFMIPSYNKLEQYQDLADKLISFSDINDHNHLEYGIYLNDLLIGMVNDCGIEHNKIEIGYMVDPNYQNKGYCTEAVKCVLNELKEMGFKKVLAGYFVSNVASYRVMEKCGFKPIEMEEYITYRNERHLCKYCQIEF